MPTANDIAHYFVSLAQNEDENDLTNLKLQKLLYFVQCEHLKETGNILFENPIEAWQFGPVVRSVYEEFSSCNAFPITGFDLPTEVNYDEIKPIEEFLDRVWKKYSKFSASYLVTETHVKGGCWDRVYNSGHPDKTIPAELLASCLDKHQICTC